MSPLNHAFSFFSSLPGSVQLHVSAGRAAGRDVFGEKCMFFPSSPNAPVCFCLHLPGKRKNTVSAFMAKIAGESASPGNGTWTFFFGPALAPHTFVKVSGNKRRRLSALREHRKHTGGEAFPREGSQVFGLCLFDLKGLGKTALTKISP